MRRVPTITATEAAGLVKDGDTLLVGGFGMTGNPVHLLHALAETGTRNLTYVGNNVGETGLGGGRLLRNGQLRKAIGSFFTSNPEAVEAAQSGRLEVELLPQGTLAEALRAAGAGIAAFFTPASAGTVLAEGRETRVLGGRPHVLAYAVGGDVAFVRAAKADRCGNLVYRMTEQNFNKAMATAARTVVAEVDEIVEVGSIPPEHVHTPGTYVDFLVEARVTTDHLGSSATVDSRHRTPSGARLRIAQRALAELRRGEVVNLGIGIPTLVADLMEGQDRGILLHTENGMLGVGPSPADGGAMQHPVNAGKIPVTALPGSSYFDSADSFAMIRGGHIDVAVMGGLQVDENGNLANWAVPGKPLLGVGGAMDLAVGAKRLIILMTHCDRNGSPKIVPECALPLTARRVVDTVITDMAVFRFVEKRLTLCELMPGMSVEQVREATAARFDIDEGVGA
jgi:3-oxoacid CoA-transferase